MARVISEDEYSQLVETDDGNIMVVARPAPGASAVDLPAPQAPAPEPSPPPASTGPLAGLPFAISSQINVPKAEPQVPQPIASPGPKPQAATDTAPDVPLTTVETSTKPPTMRDAYQANSDAFAAGDDALQAGALVDRDVANEQYAIADKGAQVQAGMERQAQIARDEREKVRAQKQADADKMVKEYEDTTIDEGRRWKNASTAKRVGWGIAMALSGLGQVLEGKGGQRNPVIDMMENWIAGDIRQQQDARAKLGKKADRAQLDVTRWEKLSADKDAQFAAQMAAELGKVDQQMRLAAMKYGGDKAMANYLASAAVLQEKKAGYLQQYAEGEAGRALQKASLNEQRAARKDAATRNDRDFAYRAGQDAFENAMKIASMKGVPDIQAQKFAAEERDKARALAVGGRAVPVKDEKGNTVDVEYKPLVNKDGTTFFAPTEKDAQDIRGSKTAVDNLLRLTDEMNRLRDEHGHEADFVKSTAWQQMQANWADAVIQAKEVDKLGVLAGPDMDIIGKQIGTSDPTEFRNIGAGLRKFRANTLANFNSKLRANNYTGDAYDIPELTNAGVQARAANTPLQAEVAQANNPQRFDPRAIVARQADYWGSGGLVPEGRMPAPQQEAALLAIAARAKNGDATAVDALRVTANSNPNPRMKSLAKQIAKDNGIDIAIGGK